MTRGSKSLYMGPPSRRDFVHSPFLSSRICFVGGMLRRSRSTCLLTRGKRLLCKGFRTCADRLHAVHIVLCLCRSGAAIKSASPTLAHTDLS